MRHVFPIAVLAACGGDGMVAPDAATMLSDARPIPDATVALDGPPSLSWVDFAVTGCTPDAPDAGAPGGDIPDAGSSDAGVPDAGDSAGDGAPDGGVAPQPCSGHAPLRLRFAAVAPADIDIYVWDFGDEGSASISTPGHVYELPGTYGVTLTVRGPGGTASRTRSEAVEVLPATLGAPCDLDAQCSTGNECVCDGASQCPASLAGGLCSVACSPDSPCGEGVCADLDAAGTPAPADWQRSLCLPTCGPDGDGACPGGLTCQDLPAADPADDEDGDGWVQGCFAPDVLRPTGASCVDAGGVPDHAVCAGGLCLELGARGMCTAACTAGRCPPSAACGDLGDISVCLARCQDAGTDCQSDPWLACELPGAPGGFTVDEPASAAGYCAVRACAAPADCGADGACVDGYCTAAL